MNYIKLSLEKVGDIEKQVMESQIVLDRHNIKAQRKNNFFKPSQLAYNVAK